MLAVLSISRWSARKHDKKVSEEVKQQKNASGNVGRYHKRLLPGDSKALDRVRKAADAARDFHYTNTLPWGQDGSRVLPKENYFDYIKEMRALRAEFDEAVSAFIREYPELRDNARSALGSMYQAEDYPDVTHLESKFGFSINFLPFPDAEDFRVSLSPEDEKEIREQIEAQSTTATAMAMKDVWTRLYEAVGRMVERLSEPDAIFRDSLVENLRDLSRLLPKLNVANDPNLDKMCQQVSKKLASQSPDVLRKDPALREKTAMDASAIVDMMRAYMPS